MSDRKGGRTNRFAPLLHTLSPPTGLYFLVARLHSPAARTTRLATSALLPSLAHARQDAAAQRDGRLGGAITFWESTQAPSKKEHTSGQHPITLEATEEHGGKY